MKNPTPKIKLPEEALVADPGSLRDPAGQVYLAGERVLRRLDSPLNEATETLLRDLVQKGDLIAYRGFSDAGAYWLESDRLAPWSYPYEWTASQLADAALLTLRLAHAAVARGFSLKDATPFNVQFQGAVPIFIDLLSFEPRLLENPWVAYHQFCAEFLGPLALAHYLGDSAAQRLTTASVAMPLQTVSRCLPMRSWLRPALLLHLHLHARAGLSTRAAQVNQSARLSSRALLALLEGLERTVHGLRDGRSPTFWQNYYGTLPGYAGADFESKRAIVTRFLQQVGRVNVALDLGCNTGTFSRLLENYADKVVAVDSDAGAVDALYRQLSTEQNRRILPLCQNLLSPSPSIGWRNRERSSFLERVKPGVTLALALVHHLAISGGISLEEIAAWLASFSNTIIIEWVPPDDVMAQQLLRRIPQLHERYRTDLFLSAMGKHYEVVSQAKVGESARTLFLLRRK